jgi:hypothetical protein
MAQHDYVIDNQGSAAARADLNNLFQAIASQNSGATAPATTIANMFWYETDTNTLWKRNEANSDWISIGVFDETAGTFTPSGGAPIATQAEAEAGTNNTKMMTPLRVFQALKSMVIDVQEFTTVGTATWTKPTDAIYSEIIVVGGGQAGRNGSAQSMCVPATAGSGGNAGGAAILSKIASALGSTETVTIGAGGATTGASGGTSSFGAHASATGGGATGGTGSGTGAQAITGNRGAGNNSAVSGGNAAETLGGASVAGPGGIATSAGVRGGGGGGGVQASGFGAGGAGYVRIVTYCA